MLKRLVFISAILIAPLAFAKAKRATAGQVTVISSPKIIIDDLPPKQFTAQAGGLEQGGNALTVTTPARPKPVQYALPFSVASEQKISIVPTGAPGDRINGMVELYMVTLIKGNTLQLVQFYVPGNPKVWPENPRKTFVDEGRHMPFCEVLNHGDFSWEKLSELNERLRLVKVSSGKFALQVKVGRLKNPNNERDIVKGWTTCREF